MFMSNVTELEQDLEDMRSVNNRLVNIYVKRSGQPEDKIRELMSEANGNGKWIDAEEAKEMGLIDEVYEPMKAAALVLSPDASAHMKLPIIPKSKVLNENSQIINDMKEELSEKFEGLKTFIAGMFKKEDSEGVSIPEDAQGKLDELEAQIAEVGNQEDRIAELEGSVETATADLATANESLGTATKDLETANARIAELEGELTKAKAPSTKIEGKSGLEDADNPADKTTQMLNRDREAILDRLA
jgi:DNA repair exonuclease SbcCD ATPase subunit